MRFASVLALFFLASCLSAPLALPRAAGADVLWDNGDPNFENGLSCQRMGSKPVSDTADDFHTDRTWTVTGASWVTVTDTTFEWDGTGDLIIYEFTPAGPGEPIVELWNVPNTREYLGEAFSRPMWAYTIDLAAVEMEFGLPAGDYYILLRPYTPGYVGSSFWLTSDAPQGSESQIYFRCEYFGYPDWVPGYQVFGEYYDVSFELTGEILQVPDAVIDLPTDDITILRHQSVEFAGTATDENGQIVDWLWTFGEGSGIDDMHTEDPGLVQFNNAGVFTVTFNAQDDEGNWDPWPDERTITVNQGFPDAVIDLPADDVVIYIGDYVEFAGAASDENGQIVDWLWTFGEGSGIDDKHVEDPGLIQFNIPGTFTVTFNAQDDDGNWDPGPDTREVHVEAAQIYVDQDSQGPEHDGLTWDTAYLTIQDGVNVCTPGGEVWVADGTYVENVVMSEGAAIYGGFLGAEAGGYEDSLDQRDFVNNVTTIDGSQSGSCIVMAVGARVDGFTITNGSGNPERGPARGGGIYCEGLGVSGVIANNVITGNSTTGVWAAGGGVFCQLSSPELTNNTIAENSAEYGGGIFCRDSASPTVVKTSIIANTGVQDGGGIYCLTDCSPYLAYCVVTDNTATIWGGGISCLERSSPTIVSCVIANNSAGRSAGGLWCQDFSSPIVTNTTIVGNVATEYWGGGVYCRYQSSPTLANCAVTANVAGDMGGGIYCEDFPPVLSHNDFWANLPNDYSGCGPGEGDISDDPMFVDPEAGDFHLDPVSPCVDTGDNAAPGLPELDFEGDPRIVDGDGDKIAVVDIGADECALRCWPTEAPDPEPYCSGALFGEPASGYPGWVWFSIPLDPSDCCDEENCYEPETLLGFSCSGRLWYWDRYGKTSQVYQPPFLQWNLAVGDGYLLYLESAVENPWYSGEIPDVDYEVKLGRLGWTWIGVPALYELGYADFMNSVRVQYPVGGLVRTAGEDYNETPGNWVQWGWSFWDTYSQAPRTFTPYSPFGNNTCYPWLGYRLWVNVGTAHSEDDPDQATLIWP